MDVVLPESKPKSTKPASKPAAAGQDEAGRSCFFEVWSDFSKPSHKGEEK